MSIGINLVSGYRGQPHVTASEDRSLYKGIFGGPFVLGNRDNPFALVGQGGSYGLTTGDAIMADGGYVTTENIDVRVEIPRPSVNSTYYIGIGRTVDDSGVESAEIGYYTQQQTGSFEEFMALYSVDYASGNFSDPVKLFSVCGDFEDFPVEFHAGSGRADWSWVKYANGLAKCWRTIGFGYNTDHAVSVQDGALYKSRFEINGGQYPFEFADTPEVRFGLGNNSRFTDNGKSIVGFISCGDSVEIEGNERTTPGAFVVVATRSGNVRGNMHIEAVGRWK